MVPVAGARTQNSHLLGHGVIVIDAQLRVVQVEPKHELPAALELVQVLPPAILSVCVCVCACRKVFALDFEIRDMQ